MDPNLRAEGLFYSCKVPASTVEMTSSRVCALSIVSPEDALVGISGISSNASSRTPERLHSAEHTLSTIISGTLPSSMSGIVSCLEARFRRTFLVSLLSFPAARLGKRFCDPRHHRAYRHEVQGYPLPLQCKGKRFHMSHGCGGDCSSARSRRFGRLAELARRPQRSK